MSKLLFSLLISFFSCLSIIAQESFKIPGKKVGKGFGKIDFQSIHMPKDSLNNKEKNMGLLGLHYNLSLNNWSYAGIGMYSAITGERGGFFTLGVNTGFVHRFGKQLFLDTGIHFGAGGGAAAPDGGGAFVLPHINLGLQFKSFSISSGWNYINFFDKGAIKSHQVNAAIVIPMDLEFASFKHRDKLISYKKLKQSDWNKNPQNLTFLFHLNNLKIKSDSPYKEETIRLAGVELIKHLNRHWLIFLKAEGAYSGIPAGYMDILVGAGYIQPIFRDQTNIMAQFGLGAGGGGGIDTNGGFLIYPNIALEQRLFKDLYAFVNKGYLLSPNSQFLSSSYGLGLGYKTSINGLKPNKMTTKSTKFKGFEVILKEDLYVSANRIGGNSKNMYQLSFQINYFLNSHTYVAGQTSFANFGDAGAYAEGIIGIGFETNSVLKSNFSLYTQVLGGGAGGGGIDTDQGLIIKPSIGIKYALNDDMNIKSALGYVKALNGNLCSTMINLGISYNFSLLTSN